MEMKKVIDILFAHHVCFKLELESSIGQGCYFDFDTCDNCEWNYRKGTAGERIEAFKIAAETLANSRQ